MFWKVGLFQTQPAQEKPSFLGSLWGLFRPKKPLPDMSLKNRDSAIQIEEPRESVCSIDPDKCSVCEGRKVFNLYKCMACNGTGLPAHKQKKKKWFKGLKSWFVKEKPKIVVVRGIEDIEAPIEPPRPAFTQSFLPQRQTSQTFEKRRSLDPGAQSEWARQIRSWRQPHTRTADSNSRLKAMFEDIERDSSVDFTELARRHAYIDVD